jgi:hypothetical protein
MKLRGVEQTAAHTQYCNVIGDKHQIDLFHTTAIHYFLEFLSLFKSQSWLSGYKCSLLRRTIFPVSLRWSVTTHSCRAHSHYVRTTCRYLWLRWGWGITRACMSRPVATSRTLLTSLRHMRQYSDLISPYEIWGFKVGENVNCAVLGCDTVQTCRWLPTFRRNLLPPSLR